MILLTAGRGAVHLLGGPPEQTKKQRQVVPTLRCLLTHRLFQAAKQFLESNRPFRARRNSHMDIMPMHISHIIMAVLRRFMLLSSSLYFAEAGRIIPLLPQNVNPFCVFLFLSAFFPKSLRCL